MPDVTEENGKLTITEHMPWGRRFLFLLLGLFPLIAPYELLLRPGWRSINNFFFLVALAISLGAVFLSGFLVFAAFAGLSTQLTFDVISRTFTYKHQAPIVPFRRDLIAWEHIDHIDLEKHDWSDGEPSYSLILRLDDGRSFKSGSFPTLPQAEAVRERVEHMLRA